MGRRVKRFRAVLEPLPSALGWVIARIPFDIAVAWKKMVRLRVKVEAGGQAFRTSLFPDPTHGGHFILVNKKMQKAAGAKVGALIDLAVEPDLEERVTAPPPEFERVFKREKALARWYGGLSEAIRRDIARSLDGIKSSEARARRAQQGIERLMLTMEAEKSLPPLVEIALRENAKARAGWVKMTATQRRSHLLGVFYCKSPEAQQKRLGKLVEDCIHRSETNVKPDYRR